MAPDIQSIYTSDKAEVHVHKDDGYYVVHLIRGVDLKLFHKVLKDYKDNLFSCTPVGHRTNRLVQRYFDFICEHEEVNIYFIKREEELWGLAESSEVPLG